ncbi:hypothetical protein TIFTF001_027493 [Ficus carica]|uniref:Uncharacterized protein n=1 Tax=Ficus carica TaxID=3494 RepID=A0AA88DNB1_FICCA|nr:hypothetical protein TIFTF001_027493 [Ficus carica]
MLGLVMQGSEEANSDQIPRLLLQAHPSTTPESQPSASPDSGQPNEGARRTFGHQPHWLRRAIVNRFSGGLAAEREIESERPRERSTEAIVAGPMSISVVGADVRLNRGRGRCPLAGYRRLLKPFKSASPNASGSHPHRELAGGGDGDFQWSIDARARPRCYVTQWSIR